MPQVGYARLGNKRAGAPGKAKPGEIAFDIDRNNPILGNPFVLRNHRDDVARAHVIERYRAKYTADLARDGPMAKATQALADRVKAGERIVCMCWCWPKPCHGTVIIDEINRRLAQSSRTASPQSAPPESGRPAHKAKPDAQVEQKAATAQMEAFEA